MAYMDKKAALFHKLGRGTYFNEVFLERPVFFDGDGYEPEFEQWVVESILVYEVFKDFSLSDFIDEYEPELEGKYNRLCDEARDRHITKEVE